MHNKREGHRYKDGLTATSIANELKMAIAQRYGHIRDYSPWIKKKNIKTWVCTCGEIFAKAANVERHIERSEKKNPECVHQAMISMSVSTVCERIISVEKINAMVEEAVNEAPSLMPPDKNTCSTIEYIPITSNNNKWLTVSLAKIKNIFTPYKRPNESIDAYLSSLKLLTIHENSAVRSRIVDSLGLVENSDRSSSDSTLIFLMDSCKVWIKDYCREHVNMLDGKSRFRLQSYFDETILVNYHRKY